MSNRHNHTNVVPMQCVNFQVKNDKATPTITPQVLFLCSLLSNPQIKCCTLQIVVIEIPSFNKRHFLVKLVLLLNAFPRTPSPLLLRASKFWRPRPISPPQPITQLQWIRAKPSLVPAPESSPASSLRYEVTATMLFCSLHLRSKLGKSGVSEACK